MTRQLVVLSGRSNPKFTADMCKMLHIEPGALEVTRFSDGEIYVEIGANVRGRDVFAVQSTSSPGNDHLMELLILIDALKRASAGRITAVIPYFGYARQDRKMKPRVPITSKLVADLVTTAGAHRVLTMDLHSGQLVGFFNIPVDNLQGLPVLIPYLEQVLGGNEIAIVSPDAGGTERAHSFASKLNNASIAIIYKRRSGPNKVAEMKVIGDVRGKRCVIVDDMVDTGGTLVKAAESLLKEGAADVRACCVHGVLSGNAIQRLEESGLTEIIITDTIATPPLKAGSKVKIVSVASLFAEAVRRIHHEDSVSTLFH